MLQSVYGNGNAVRSCFHRPRLRRPYVASSASPIEGHNGAFPQRHLFFLHCKTGALDAAATLFALIPHAHILIWNAFIQAHLRKGIHQKSFHIFDQMLQEGILPNKVTFAGLLSACALLQWPLEGTHVHARIQFGKLSSNLIVRTALLDMYGKCGSLDAALESMEILPERDAVTFNAMLTSLQKHCLDKEILQLFEQMQQEAVMPNRVTYLTVVEACAMHDMLAESELIYARTFSLKEYQKDLSLGNAFIHMYGKCSLPDKAEKHFLQMPAWDAVSWNTLLGICDHQRNIRKVLDLFNLMQVKGFFADECTYITLLSSCASHRAGYEGMCVHFCVVHDGLDSKVALSCALLSMYGKCSSVEDATRLFDQMTLKNVVCWNAMIAVCTQHDNNEAAVHHFHHMMGDGMHPDNATFANVLTACANAALLSEGKSIYLLACKCGLQSDPMIGTSLVNMFGKCGELKEARKVFSQIQRSTIFSWNVMLTLYAYHGEGEIMFGLFNQMQKEGLVPDGVACLAFLLGCNYLGLISEGVKFFVSVYHLYRLVPDIDHYVCMIDLLAKAGQLEEAAFVVDVMPFLSHDVSITALASAYNRSHAVQPNQHKD